MPDAREPESASSSTLVVVSLKRSGKAKARAKTKRTPGKILRTAIIRGERPRIAHLASRKTAPPPQQHQQPLHNFLRIHDRKTVGSTVRYQVLWSLDPHPVSGKSVPITTWEPAACLRKDGLSSCLRLVDDWVDKVERRIPFEQYLKSSQLASRVMGASEDNDCVLVAVKAVFEAQGRFHVATQQRFVEFCDGLPFDTSAGLAHTKLTAFLAFLFCEAPGCAIDRKEWYVNRYAGERRGIAAIFNLNLEQGFYLAGVSNSWRVGHCVALKSVWGTYWVFDENKWVPLGDVDFIANVHFVSRLQLVG